MQNQDIIINQSENQIQFCMYGDFRDTGHNVMTKAGGFYTFQAKKQICEDLIGQ